MVIERLSKAFRPSHYNLEIEPDYSELTFSGVVVIDGIMVGPAKQIKLHNLGLQVRSATVAIDDKKIKLSIGKPAAHDVQTFTSDTLLPKGRLSLRIEYRGKITEQLHGIYPSRYRLDGQERLVLATQLESHHAREVLPCVDEPAAKATFEISLTAPVNYQVISNTLPVKETLNGGQKTVHFAPTPKMSPYLLAFVAGELESIETTTNRGVVVRCWTTPGKTDDARFALETAAQVLDFYEDYFDIEYPLDKCDMLALPDFVTGAMENWGCIVYRETAMLVDKSTSLAGKQQVAIVVAHELAHQWFGNLVTMEWWTDLWLNEGFASWIEYLAVDNLFPQWEMWTEFVTGAVFRGQQLDSLASSHPVEVKIDDPDQIRAIFDAISYEKGASVIGMLEQYLGEQTFRDGLRHYLKKYSYANARTKDLWAALEESSNKPVSEFMSVWTTKKGFPFVTIKPDGKLRQQHFLLSPNARSTKTVWPIPLLDGHDQLLDTKSSKLANPPTLLNRGRKGFFYTAYPENFIDKLAGRIKSGSLSAVDRLGLLHETFELAKAGHQSTVNTLKLLGSFENEAEAPVWDVIADIIGHTRKVFETDRAVAGLRELAGSLASEQARELGLKPQASDDHNRQRLRPKLLSLASFARDEQIIELTRQAYRKNDLHADTMATVFATLVREDGEKIVDELIDRHNASESAAERMKLAAGITSISDAGLSSKIIDHIKSDEVRKQDVYYWVAYLCGNRHAKRRAWEWMKTDWQWFVDHFASDIATFAYFPKFAASSFADKEFEDDFAAFFENAYHSGIDLQIEQALETVRWQRAWRERDHRSLENFLVKTDN